MAVCQEPGSGPSSPGRPQENLRRPGRDAVSRLPAFPDLWPHQARLCLLPSHPAKSPLASTHKVAALKAIHVMAGLSGSHL